MDAGVMGRTLSHAYREVKTQDLSIGSWKPAFGASIDSRLRRSQRDGQAGEEPTRKGLMVGTVLAAAEHVKSRLFGSGRRPSGAGQPPGWAAQGPNSQPGRAGARSARRGMPPL